LGFCDAADADAPEGGEKTIATRTGQDREGEDEADYEEQEIEIWQYVPAADGSGIATCDAPEEEQGQGERDGEGDC
jgi:hypothetical protein